MKLQSMLCACALAAISGLVSQANAQVKLTTISPSTAQPLVTQVSVTGNGFPPGNIAPAAVTITLTPSVGNGGPVTTTPTAVTSIGSSGSTRQVKFFVPSSLTAASPFTADIAIAGTTSLGATFTGAGVPLTINPPAAIANVSPGAATRGAAVTLVLSGLYSHFLFGSSSVSAGPGVSCLVNPVGITPVSLTAACTIDPAAAPGLRDITVTTNLGAIKEVASALQSFLVSASPALAVASFNPASVLQGQTVDVAIGGMATHFIQGTTIANFSQGVKINSVTVNSQTSATVNITVDSLTYSGYRTVTLVTGGEYALSDQMFFIGPSPATLSGISPAAAVQGQTLTSTVTGVGTHFAANSSNVRFGMLSGVPTVTTGNVQVLSPTSLTVDFTVLPGSALGTVPVTVTTGGETATLQNAFTIGAATPVIYAVTPPSGSQNQTLDVTLTGSFTNFQPGATLNFGSGITVNSVSVLNGTTLTANISIDTLASSGARSGTVHTQGLDLPFSFTVQPSGAAITSASPNYGQQGTSLTINVTGAGTHFVQGTTAASISCCSVNLVTINRITVTSQTAALIDVTIPPNEPAVVHNFTMSTGGEIVSVPGGFQVIAATPSLTMTPSSGGQGTNFPVEFTGQFTGFVQGLTTVNIAGTGVTISNFVVTGPNSATAIFTVDLNAPLTPFNPYLPRIVTLTTGTQIVTTGFAVTKGDYLASLTPNIGSIGQTLTVAIQGVLTHFVNGQTTFSMGPDVTVANVTVTSPTTAVAQISISNTAALGWRTAFVNTGAEYDTAGFLITLPFNASLISVAPGSGDQGQSLTVTLTGQHANFQQGVTQAIIGAGITVNGLTVIDRNSATAQISILPTVYPGPRTVSVITGTEIVSGLLFSVKPGVAILTGVSPNSGFQGQVLNVNISGANTNFLQGLTTASVSGGITVSALNVTSPTTATAQLSIGANASLGLQTVSLSTAGEVATVQNGFTVSQATATLLSATPSSGDQATVQNVTLLGQSTHWVQGVTTASFGLGITVNSVTVSNPVTALANISIGPTAGTGFRNVSATTGAEFALLNSGFLVTPGAASLTSLAPASARQGDTVTVHVTGLNTNFQQGVTSANAGLNINVGTVTVQSQTSADVMLAIGTTAVTGLRSLTLNTLGESATLVNGFTVNPGIPTLNSASPNTLQQGMSGTLTVLGQFTHFQQGVTTVTLGQGITVGTITVTGPSSLTVSVTVDSLANGGSRAVTITTGGEIVSGNYFSVSAGPAIISSITPNHGSQGQTLDVIITGQTTHFAQGITGVSFGSQDITLNLITVNSLTSLTANISITNTAFLGVRSVSVSTGGEQLTQIGGFNVNGGIPVILGLNPASAKQGDTNLNVQITGQFTNWAAGTTVALGSPDLILGAVTINNPTSITAVISASATASLGVKTITVTTGSQVLTANFTVNTSATVPSITYTLGYPSSALAGQTLTTQFTGANTHFSVGSTTASFGAGITVNNTQVLGPGTVNVNITIDPNAAAGVRTVTIMTGGEAVTSTFSVVIGTPSIILVNPASAIQGDTNKNINITGQYTTFVQGTTTANFGAGVTVNSVTVNGPVSATINISADVLATAGFRNFSVTTGTQVVNNPLNTFAIGASTAAISGVAPSSAKQGDSLTVLITGLGTHFAQGVTTANFGGGINVTSLTINSPTSATANITIAALASIGVHSITLTTVGENATVAAGFTVNPGTPVILSSSPLSGLQQMDVTLAVLGQYTTWIQGQTTANLGAGVTVTAVTVTSQTSLQISAHVTPLALTGLRDLAVTTNSQVLVLPNAFSVVSGPAAISSLNPATAKQGDSAVSIAITGVNSNWGAGTTAAFGPGITVNSLTINGPMSATAVITVSPAAIPAIQTVTLTTQGEASSIAQGFTIQGATPVLVLISPASATQGQTVDVTVNGQLTNFVQGTTTSNFGAGITVNSVTVQSATRAVVNITVQPTAVAGVRDVSLATGAEIASKLASFTVQAASAALTTLVPNSGRQNQSALSVAITGTATNFLQGTTTANFGAGITVVSLTVNSATSATAILNIASNATLGTRNVTLTTGGEIAALAGGFAITPTLLQITTLSLPNANTGVAYSQTIGIGGGLAPFTFSISSGSLPAGLTLNAATGAIAGPPTTPATSTFEITVSDFSSQTAKRTYTLIDSDPLTITTTALDPGINGLPYSFTAVAQGGVAPLTFSILNGALPTGITLTGTTGVIAGTPTVNGTANLTLRVTDNIGQVFDRPLSIPIYAPVTFTTATLPNGRRTVAYNQPVSFAGGVPAISVTVSNGALPGGLTLNSATGVINGTPAAAGTFNFQLTATDAKSHTAIQALAIVVADALSITTGATLPNGFNGMAYSQTIQTANGVAPVNFGITVGSLPAGLSLATSTGVISGVPSVVGPSSFTIQATDSLGLTSSVDFTLQIVPPPVILTVSPSQASQGQTLDITVTGQFTNFVNGVTAATFGIGVTVNTVTVSSATVAVVNVTVAAAAAPGSRAVTLTTGTEVVTAATGFSVLSALPTITSITPPFGKKGTTVTVAVAGNNLLGATFSLKTVDPSDHSTPATVSIVSNTGTLATLTLVLGPTEGAFPLVATTSAGASAITGATEFLISPTINTATFYLSVLNTTYDPTLNPPLPPGKNTATTYVSVLNTSYDPTLNPPIPAGKNTASAYLSVLNTTYDPTLNPPLPAGKNSASAYASVLNTAFTGGVTYNFANSLAVTVCNRNNGCAANAPAAISASVDLSTPKPAASSTTASNALVPILDPMESIQHVIAGQSVRLTAQNVDLGSTVDFEVNHVSVAQVGDPPYDTLFTVPEGLSELTFRVVVTGPDGSERVSQLTRMIVMPDRGAGVSGTIEGGKEGVALELAAAGLKAEFFHFTSPLAALPSLDGMDPVRTNYVTAVNQPNPRAVFGPDPLGALLDSDYAVRFSGEFWADKAGEYSFWLAAHSGAMIAIDGKPLAESGFAVGDPEDVVASLALDRGWHRIAVIYYQAVGAASVRLEWRQPDTLRREVLSAEYLRTAIDGMTAVSGADGRFAFTQVPAKFDTVWLRVRQGKDITEYPALKPGADLVVVRVRD